MEKKYTSPAIKHGENRRKIRNYSILGAAVLGTAAIMYFATRNNDSDKIQLNTNNVTPNLIIEGDVINSNISVVDLENSELNVNGTYHVGNRCGGDSLYQKTAVDSVYQNSNSVSKTTEQKPVDKAIDNKVVDKPKKENSGKPVVEFIDDCVDGMDLFQNPILLNDLQKTMYENQKAN